MTTDAGTTTAAGRVLRWARWPVLVAVLVALGLLGYVWRHPSAFRTVGGGAYGRERPVGEPMYIAFTYPDPHSRVTVDIDEVTAYTVTGTAAPELAYVVCTLDPRVEGSLGSGDQASLEEYCSSITPADGSRLSLGRDPRQQLMVGVTATAPGVAKIQGIDVTYADGWQHGTQRIDGEVVMRTVGWRR